MGNPQQPEPPGRSSHSRQQLLGPRFEENFRRALLISRGDATVFVNIKEHPISAFFIFLAVMLIVVQIYVRLRKPKLIVEAGVHEGLGSEILLRALQRNAEEGAPGHLLSFDIHDDTGWLVAPQLRSNWTFTIESTLTGMRPALRGLVTRNHQGRYRGTGCAGLR